MQTHGIFGFYPIVDRAERLHWLASLGVLTAQIRIKDLEGAALRQEVEAAVGAVPQLYLNDHWQLAHEVGISRIHLGQEDLSTADPEAIASLELGVSTHSPDELDEALSWDPAYVALGPVWETTLKKMPWAPQTPARVTEWKARVGRPLVAIGGITLERAPLALHAGADAIAIVSDIQRGSPRADRERVEAWLRLFDDRQGATSEA